MIVFLDFDGVLHPDAARRRWNGTVYLDTRELPPEYQQHTLFCYAQHLEGVIADFPGVDLVLSTDWAYVFGLDAAVKRLPAALQSRVIGRTYHPRHTPGWPQLSRHQQIMCYVDWHQLGTRWLALDNDGVDWPVEKRGNLVLTEGLRGIADPEKILELRERIEANL